MKWTEDQQLAIDSRNSNILVAAAAGSGKTAVLVERIIKRILDPVTPINIDEILVATFTNAAAEEMRNRIAEALEGKMEEEPHSSHLKKQLSLIQRSYISTLHSFCTTVVRQYSYLLDIDPSFRIGDEMEMDLIKQDILDELFEEKYGQDLEEAERFFTVVDMFTSDRNDLALEELILKIHEFSRQNPWPNKWLDDVVAAYKITIDDEGNKHLPWLSILQKDIKEQVNHFINEINRALKISLEVDGPEQYVDNLKDDLILLEKISNSVYDWENLHTVVNETKFSRLSSKKSECDESKKEFVKATRKVVTDQIKDWQKQLFNRSFSSHVEDMEKLHPYIEIIVDLVKQFEDKYQKVKKEKAIVDFTDLEHYCLAILLDEESTENKIVPSSVANHFKEQFKEVLVDEYQDINLVQETILQLVSDQTSSGNMFMVGDIKQSIYRFRHADPTLFIDKYNEYAKNPSAGLRIDLAKNFRSRPEVLTGVNYLFKQIFDEALGDISYDEKAELVYGNLSYDDIKHEDPSIELLMIDQNKNEQADDNEDVEKAELEAKLYAKKIKEWVGTSGTKPMQVIDKETGQKRDAKYRDIVILLRAETTLPTIMEQFKTANIPVYAELKSGYFEAMEIQIMLNYLKIIDNPYQDIPLASILKSPIVGLNEQELTEIRLAKKSAHFYEAVVEAAKKNNDLGYVLSNFLNDLHYFREQSQREALSKLIWDIFQKTGYYDFVGGIAGGKQRQANLRALYDRAKVYEETSFRGLFRFLRFIERMQEQRKDLGEARALSEQEDVVRIMTIHKSKGLEFPIVILGNVGKEFFTRDLSGNYLLNKEHGFATKYIDPVKRINYTTLYYKAIQTVEKYHMLSEEMRVLYVALTRAKEKLVMIGTVKEAEKKLEKEAEFVTSHEAWTLPAQYRRRAKTYLDWIIPALIRHKQNEHLRLEQTLSPFISDEIINHDSKWKINIVTGQSLIDEDLTEEEKTIDVKQFLQDWKGLPQDLLNDKLYSDIDERLSFEYSYQAAAKSRAKQSVTEIKRRLESVDEYSGDSITKQFTRSLTKRPQFLQAETELSAAEKGTAMHAFMQHIPLIKEWSRDELRNFGENLYQKELLTKEEVSSINYDAIESFFTTDLGKKMLHNRQVEREIPFTYRVSAKEIYQDWSGNDEFVLVQGVIDCLIFEEDDIIIVDYKTDKINEEVNSELYERLKKRYEIQVNLYKEAVEKIIGKRVKETYLYFFDKNLTVTL